MLLLGVSCYASENKVYDYGDVLSQNEEYVLQQLALEFEQETGIKCLVLTDNRQNGTEHALDFYKSKYSEKEEGVVFFLYTQHSEVNIATNGNVSKILDKFSIREAISEGRPDIRKRNYGVALVKIINSAKDKVTAPFAGFPPAWYLIGTGLISLITPLLFALYVKHRYSYVRGTDDLEKYSDVKVDVKMSGDTFIRSYVKRYDNGIRK